MQGAREAQEETERLLKTTQVTVMRQRFFKAPPPSEGDFEVPYEPMTVLHYRRAGGVRRYGQAAG